MYYSLYTQCLKACAVIPCPHQLPTSLGNTILVAKNVLLSMMSSAAFATGQDIVFCLDVSVSVILNATASQIFNVCKDKNYYENCSFINLNNVFHSKTFKQNHIIFRFDNVGKSSWPEERLQNNNNKNERFLRA